MRCPRCRTPMREEKRSFHKQRKWVCPSCGRIRMQAPRASDERREGRPRGDE